ncbi:hypothetical protein [Lysinibacillus telephonicus]|uniref:hypothetical protein n=1 Tax=Lysinibacillus telephonicus TaxID=1714840 RepID=UPI003BA095DF
MSIKKFLTVFIVSFIIFGTGSNLVSADLIEDDDLLNGVVKDAAHRFCLAVGTAGSKDNESLQEEVEVEVEVEEEDINTKEFETQSSGWSGQLDISESGSSIYLPVEEGNTLNGYCHIYVRHMQYANGQHKQKHNGVSQFENARYPITTMEIIMEVINRDSSVEYHPTIKGRGTKTAFSPTEGQQVTVVMQKGSTWSGGKYDDYDWVIISAYPSGY